MLFASAHPLHSYAVLTSTSRGGISHYSWPGLTIAVMIVRGIYSPEQQGALLQQLPGPPRGAPSPRGPSPATEGGLLRPPTWPALSAAPALAAGTSPGQACPGRPAAAFAGPRLVVRELQGHLSGIRSITDVLRLGLLAMLLRACSSCPGWTLACCSITAALRRYRCCHNPCTHL